MHAGIFVVLAVSIVETGHFSTGLQDFGPVMSCQDPTLDWSSIEADANNASFHL